MWQLMRCMFVTRVTKTADTTVPDVLLHMPGGQIVSVDPAGRVKKETRQ